MKNDIESVRLKLADLCARSEQCESDIRKKLSKTSLTPSERVSIIIFLKENKFLDDGRFAKAFARDKVRFSSWGKNKIRAALIAKRLSSDAIQQGISAIDEQDYLDAIKRAGEAKAKNLNIFVREDAAKFVRHLQAKGFEYSLIFKLLEALKYIQSNNL